jgi:hypothetical protein
MASHGLQHAATGEIAVLDSIVRDNGGDGLFAYSVPGERRGERDAQRHPAQRVRGRRAGRQPVPHFANAR